MTPDQELPLEVFRRVIREAIDREAFDCSSEATPLQSVCLSYQRSEQAWLNKRLQTLHVRQPGIIYGFYESPQDELQAYAIENRTQTPGFIAVSSFCVVSFGFFFRAALAHRNVLNEFGNSSHEMSPAEMGPGPHTFAAPRDPERLQLAKLITMMAIRFLTAHEMTHILNGHIRYKLGIQNQNSMAEARQRLSPRDAIFRQTLEMDADAGCVVECMPFVIFAEKDPEEPIRIGCHAVYRTPEAALRLWLFAVYGICRLLSEGSPPIPIEESSHPSPMLRVRMIMGTLYEFLKREKLGRLLDLVPGLIGQAIQDGEAAYAAVLNRTPNTEPLGIALSDEAQKQIAGIIAEWRHVRPIIEPFARSGGRLAPLPDDL